MKKLLFLLAVFSLLTASCRTVLTESAAMKLVSFVDVERYSGLWYQVGRYPHFFQTDDCGESTAEYTLREDGKIEVLNRCWKDSAGGEWSSEVRAVATPLTDRANHLKVLFYGVFPADYLIIELDSLDYEWAAVTTPGENTLWILSRKPSLPTDVYESIVRSLESKGFEPEKILKTSRQR